MWLGIFRSERGGFLVGVKGVVGLGTFQEMAEREPGAGLTFFNVVSGLELGGGSQELLSFRAVGTRQH